MIYKYFKNELVELFKYNLQLIQFKKNPGSFSYHLKFSDGTEGDLTTKQIRDNCPCASCSGEQVLLREYKPVNKVKITEAGYKLEKAQPVGNYALQLAWLDGHDTGIYTWDHLKFLLSKFNTKITNES